MRVLIAFDKYKDAMSATEACAVAASALRKVQPQWELELCPISDGSEGFATILTQARGGELIYQTVMGPTWKPVEAHIGLVDCAGFSLSSKAWLKLPDKGKVAVVEMAQASGITRITPEERNLWYTSSHGTGELIRMALGLNPDVIIIGMGGTATHDLGMGALEALGLRYRAENGELIDQITPHQWSRVVAIEGSLPTKLPRIILAPNVHSRLLGARGAAAQYGAPKGLKRSDLNMLESQTQRMAELMISHFGARREIINEPGSGAAGGIAVGLRAALEARTTVEVVMGIELANRWLRLGERIDRAQVIITGEDRFDLASLEGRAPQHVIEKASHKGKRIHCVVRSMELEAMGGKLPLSLSEANMHVMGEGSTPDNIHRTIFEGITETIKRVMAAI